jgi:hypothetical protein
MFLTKKPYAKILEELGHLFREIQSNPDSIFTFTGSSPDMGIVQAQYDQSIMSNAFDVMIFPSAPPPAPGGCMTQMNQPPGEFKTTKLLRGIRTHENQFYRARDNIVANSHDDCLLWCIKSAVRAHPLLKLQLDCNLIRCHLLSPPYSLPKGPIELHHIQQVIVCVEKLLPPLVAVIIQVWEDSPNIVGYNTMEEAFTRIEDQSLGMFCTDRMEHAKDKEHLVRIEIMYSRVFVNGNPTGHFSLLDKRLYSNEPPPISKKLSKKSKPPIDAYIHFDFETCLNSSGELLPYSFAFCLQDAKTFQVTHVDYGNLWQPF